MLKTAVFVGGALILLRFCYNLVVAPKALRKFKKVPSYAIFKSQLLGSSYYSLWWDYFRPAFEQDKFITTRTPLFWLVQVGDYEVAKYIALHPEQFPKALFLQKVPGISKTLAGSFFGYNIVASEGDTWKRFHKISAKAFSRIWPTEVIGGLAAKFISMVEQNPSQVPLDVTPWLKRLTFDVLSETVLDLKIDALHNDEAKLYWHIQLLMRNVLKVLWIMVYPFDRAWNPWRKPYFSVLKDYHQILNSTIETKKREYLESISVTEREKKKDLLSLLIAANAEEDGKDQLTPKELRDNLTVFFIAGHDTTATALTATLYLLAKHPEIQEKAREEVMATLSPKAIPSHQDLRQMPYVLAIIKESQRLYPSAAQIGFRQVAFDFTLPDGRIIPKDSLITANIVQINRDPKNWPNPHEFNPERFLQDPDNLNSTAQSANYLTFFYGKRICLGMQFSLVEQRVILSMLLRTFRWRLADSSAKLNFGPPALLVPKSLPMIFDLV